jgi:hypothetical protein
MPRLMVEASAMMLPEDTYAVKCSCLTSQLVASRISTGQTVDPHPLRISEFAASCSLTWDPWTQTAGWGPLPTLSAGDSPGTTSASLAQLLHWTIVGGESGPHARPCYLEWVRSLGRQCKSAGVPVFVKQLGRHPVSHSEGEIDYELRLAHAKGEDPDEWPSDLRVQEWPA